jgi:hypothetical protein
MFVWRPPFLDPGRAPEPVPDGGRHEGAAQACGVGEEALRMSKATAVQITRFGSPEVLDIVDIPEPVPGPGQPRYDVSTAGVNYADTHHRLSGEVLRGPGPGGLAPPLLA